jgi:hypothetical protein
MKKDTTGEVERRPFAITQKIQEMKGVKAEIHAALKGVQVKEERVEQSRIRSVMDQTAKSVMKAGALPVSLQIKRTHSLGDFYGKFHPSKSKRGIKRSE